MDSRKEALVLDSDGYFKTTTLVTDDVTGVFPIYEAWPQLPEPEATGEPTDEPAVDRPDPVIVGYTVALPIPTGMYLGVTGDNSFRFDLSAWQAYQDAVAAAQAAWTDAMQAWTEQAEEERGEPPLYVPPEQPAFWVEGLTPEEIEEIRNRPETPTQLDILGQQLVERELESLEIKTQNDIIGQQLVDMDLRLLQGGM